MPVPFVKQIFKRGKDRKERKTVVYNNPLKTIFLQYLPFSSLPNQLKTADFCVSM